MARPLVTVEAPARLLTDQELAELGPPEAVRIPLDLVDPNPRNPRANLVEVDVLADNIKTLGLLQPVTVRRIGERYELLGGHRRRAAFNLLLEREPHDVQWKTIPAVIRTADDELADLMLISGQTQVVDWKPKEQAAALERMKLAGMTITEIGESLNRTVSWASKRLRVYADSVLSGYVQSGRLQHGIAEVFISVKDPEMRRDLAERAAAEDWSQPQAQSEVRKLRLDTQLRDLGKRVQEMLAILSAIEPSRIPIDSFRELQVLRGRIEVISTVARGGAPKIPTIAEAERRAGVRTQDRPTRGRRRPGYKPRL